MSDVKTTAPVPVPPKKERASRLEAMSAAPIKASDNMKESDWQNLSFKVSPDLHQEFKMTASRHRMSMKDLLVEGFELWKKKNL